MDQVLKSYRATPVTAGFIEALRQIHDLGNTLITTLREKYGEEMGEEIYLAEYPKLEALAAVASKHLIDNIEEQFGTLDTPPDVI